MDTKNGNKKNDKMAEVSPAAERNHQVQTVDSTHPIPVHFGGGGDQCKGTWSESQKGRRKGSVFNDSFCFCGLKYLY